MANVAVVLGTMAFLPMVLGHAGWLGSAPAVDPHLASRLLRGAAVALLLACSLPIGVRRLGLPGTLAVAGAVAAVLMFLVRPPSSHALDSLFWNGVVVVLLCAVVPGAGLGAAGVGRAGLELSVALQAVLSIGLAMSGFRQSDNNGWVGATGNANTFAFLCLLVIVRLLFRRAMPWWHVPLLALATLGVLESGSLFGAGSLALLVCVVPFFGARPAKVATIVLVALALIGGVRSGLLGEAWGTEALAHVAFKARSMYAVMVGDAGNIASGSVGLRGSQWRAAIAWFGDSPMALAVGGVGGGSYFAADSQVLTYVSSFGLPVAMAMLAPVALAFSGLRRTGARRAELGFQLLLVAVFLVVNRGLDYFCGGVAVALLLAEMRDPAPADGRT